MPIRDDSAGSYGTWDNNDLSWIDWLKANASDGGNALSNLGRNLVDGFSPIGTSEQGNMALQVPPIVSGIADSYGRLAGTPNNPGNAYNLSGVPELDAPIQQDMSNVLLSLYGGNAAAGLARSRSVPTSGRVSNVPAAQLAHEEFGWPVLQEYGRRRPGGVGGFESYESYLPPPSIAARDFRKQTSVDFHPKLANENDYAAVGYLKALEGQQRDKSGLSVVDGGRQTFADGAAQLPMDQASRMARAREMGFDTEMPWYHGTHSEFSQFKPSEDGYIGPGVYMSGDSGRAAEYGPYVGEYRVRGDLIDEYEVSKIASELYAAGVKNPHAQALEEMKRRGYSGVINGQDVTVWDPSNIRSVNAAFDPARAGENGLLLSDNRPSLLGSALATGGENYDLPEWLRF